MPKNDLRVRGVEVGPLAGNRAHRRTVNLQQESPAVTVIALADAHERLAAQRMEGMGHAHKVCRTARRVRILD